MRRRYLVLFAAVISTAVIFGCSKGYESQKAVDDVSITLKADRYPLIKGDNSLAVSVVDTAGKAVPDAAVQVRYYMPPMPGMAPMEFNTQAAPKGPGYSFTANIPMEGGWKAEVTVTRPGKPVVTSTFNLDAR